MISPTPNNQSIDATTTKFKNKPLLSVVIPLVGLLLILILVNIGITKYETHLKTGDTVLLDLAPVDPRGFMQGDYMALEFQLADDIFEALTKRQMPDADNDAFYQMYNYSTDGIAIIKKDANNVGHFVRLVDKDNIDRWDKQTLADNELSLYFRVRKGQVKIATNAFFFQEGHAKVYESAEYGLFRVNDKGEPLLAGMVDGDFKVIEVVDNVEVVDDTKVLDN